MPSPGRGRRRSPRLKARLAVRWSVPGLRDRLGCTQDVSLAGLRIAQPRAPEGAPIWLEIRLPDGRRLALRGMVLWIGAGFGVRLRDPPLLWRSWCAQVLDLGG